MEICEEDSIDLEALYSYLPASILSYLLDESNISRLITPSCHGYETCVLFADVSGFTALTEALSILGPEGAEQLAKHLNSYFEQLVRIIGSQGGDVFKFAGDALLVLWPKSEEDLTTCVRRATQCALEIQNNLHNAKLSDNPPVSLSIKLGIGVGSISIIHVGGVLNRVEYLATGHPLVQAFHAEHLAVSGQVICSPEAWSLVNKHFEASEVKDGAQIVTKCLDPIRKVSVYTTVAKSDSAQDKAFETIRNYVPGAVIPFLSRTEEKWASELRRITGLNESDLLSIGTPEGLARVQKVMVAVQSAVYRYEGSVNKFLMDDKGSTMIAVFGLPPLAHEDDSTRGILCSLAVCSKLHEIGLCPSVGITTGVAFCGVVGSRGSRREYSVLGDVVNLSARLMQHATLQGGGVLCDSSTQYSSRDRVSFEQLESIQVKGKSKLIKLFQPYPTSVAPMFSRNSNKLNSPNTAPHLDKTFSPVITSSKAAELLGYAPLAPVTSPTGKSNFQSVSYLWESIWDPDSKKMVPTLVPTSRTSGNALAGNELSLSPGAKYSFTESEVDNKKKTRTNRITSLSKSMVAAFAEQARVNSSSNMFSPMSRLFRRKTEIEINPKGAALSTYAAGLASKENYLMYHPKSKQLLAEIRRLAKSFDSNENPYGVAVIVESGIDRTSNRINFNSMLNLPTDLADFFANKRFTPLSRIAILSELNTKYVAPIGSSGESFTTRANRALSAVPFLVEPVIKTVQAVILLDSNGYTNTASNSSNSVLIHCEKLEYIYQLKDKILSTGATRHLLSSPYSVDDFYLLINEYPLPLENEMFRIDYLLAFLSDPDISNASFVEIALKKKNINFSHTRNRDSIHNGYKNEYHIKSCEALTSRIHRLLFNGQGGTVIIQGESGLGKSRFISTTACNAPCEIYCAAGNPFEKRPLSVWREIFLEILDAEILKNLSEYKTDLVSWASQYQRQDEPNQQVERRRKLRKAVLASRMKLLPAYSNYLAVLNDFLSVDFPETDESGDLDPEERFAQLIIILIPLMQLFSFSHPFICVVDDAVYLDKMSWDLFRTFSIEAPNTLFILVTRPINKSYMGAFDKEIPEEYTQLLEDRETLLLNLQPLSDDAILKIAFDCLSVKTLPDALANKIKSKCHGNPMACKELCYALRELGLIMIDKHNRCIPSEAFALTLNAKENRNQAPRNSNGSDKTDFKETIKAAEFPIPATLQSRLGCRIDRLTHIQKMILKTAATIGSDFDDSLLLDSFPSIISHEQLIKELDQLCEMNIFNHAQLSSLNSLKTDSSEFSFADGFMLDMIISRMLTDQRKRLKNRVRECFEKRINNRDLTDGKNKWFKNSLTLNKPSNMKVGYLSVRKNRDFGYKSVNEWKQRWLVLTEESISLYYDDADPRCLGVIFLENSTLNTILDHHNPLWEESVQKETYIRIDANVWNKKGVVYRTPRSYYMAGDDAEETQEWCTMLQIASNKIANNKATAFSLKNNLSSPEQLNLPSSRILTPNITPIPHRSSFHSSSVFLPPGRRFNLPRSSNVSFNLSQSTTKKASDLFTATGLGAFPLTRSCILLNPIAMEGMNLLAQNSSIHACSPTTVPLIIPLMNNETFQFHPAVHSFKHIATYPAMSSRLTAIMNIKKDKKALFSSDWKMRSVFLTDEALIFNKGEDESQSFTILCMQHATVNAIPNAQFSMPHVFSVTSPVWVKYDQDKTSFSPIVETTSKTVYIAASDSGARDTWLRKMDAVIVECTQEYNAIVLFATELTEDSKTIKTLSPESHDKRMRAMTTNERSSTSKKAPETAVACGPTIYEAVVNAFPRPETPVEAPPLDSILQSSNDIDIDIVSPHLPAPAVVVVERIDQILQSLVNTSGDSVSAILLIEMLQSLRQLTIDQWKDFGENISNTFKRMVYNCDIDQNTKDWLTHEFTRETSNENYIKNGSSPDCRISIGGIFGQDPMTPFTPAFAANTVRYTTKSFPSDFTISLTELETWNWDIFAYSPEQLCPIVLTIFQRFKLLSRFKISEELFCNFILKVRDGYLDNDYHNWYHAVDVLQTVYVLLTNFDGQNFLTSFEKMCLLMAALGHDIGHPGLNNTYQINAQSSMALLYNDQSVLENFHASTFFKLIGTSGSSTSILGNFTKDDYNKFRNLVISSILSTDMTLHFSLIQQFNSFMDTLRTKEDAPIVFDDLISSNSEKRRNSVPPPPAPHQLPKKDILIRILLHSADISNQCKSWMLAKKWADCLLIEFFKQGDLEKLEGLTISPNMDRNATDQPSFSLNFIDFIVAPLFVSVRELMPNVDTCCEFLRGNRQNWEDMVENRFKIASRTNLLDDKMNEEWQRWKRRAIAFNEILMINNSKDVVVENLYASARKSVYHPHESPNMTPQNSNPSTPAYTEDKPAIESGRRNSLLALESFCKANSKVSSPALKPNPFQRVTSMNSNQSAPTVRFMSMDSLESTENPFKKTSRGLNLTPHKNLSTPTEESP